MIWGCMSAMGLGRYEAVEGTINAAKYQEILTHSLLPSARDLYPDMNFIFQQDGAACHTAKTTKKWFGDNNIKVLSWPSNSLDLNVIETLWHKMKQKLRDDPQCTVADLKMKLRELWHNFDIDACQSLIKTMPDRIAAVVKAHGDVTPY